MISSLNANSVASYLLAQRTATADGGDASAEPAVGAAAKSLLAAHEQAALQKAGSAPKAAASGHALDKQQATLATDLRSAMTAAGVKLTGTVDFSVGSDGTVKTIGGDADKAATAAFLKADAHRPSFATRIATQAKDALTLSTTIQQNAAISQATRYGGTPKGVMSLYTSLMPQAGTTTAVFSLSPASSSLTYPGSLAAKA